jgi:hypothetical protein
MGLRQYNPMAVGISPAIDEVGMRIERLGQTGCVVAPNIPQRVHCRGRRFRRLPKHGGNEDSEAEEEVAATGISASAQRPWRQHARILLGRLRFQPSRPAPSLPHQAPASAQRTQASRERRQRRRASPLTHERTQSLADGAGHTFLTPINVLHHFACDLEKVTRNTSDQCILVFASTK